VNASGNLIAPFEVITNINTLGQKTTRVNVGRYRFVDTRVEDIVGASAEVSTKLSI